MYEPLLEGLRIHKSEIDGQGLFTLKFIKENTNLGMTHIVLNHDLKRYEKGTYIIYASQAFRPHLLDMMEPQNYPELKDASGKPKVPYDLAGWTLPLQMGIRVHKVAKPFKATTNSVNELSVKMPSGVVSGKSKKGYTFYHNTNAAFIALNKLLSAGSQVYLTKDGNYFLKGSSQSEKIKLKELIEYLFSNQARW